MQQTNGTIVTWKPDRGFGFIRPTTNGPDVFVHVRDFGIISRAPQVGDAVTYMPMRDKDGRYRAADVNIAGVPRAVPAKPLPSARRSSAVRVPATHPSTIAGASPRIDARNNVGWLRGVLLAVVVLAIGVTVAAYRHDAARPRPQVTHDPRQSAPAVRPVIEAARYTCQGKTRCNEMNSCEEATFYLRNCPGTAMDGDGDGIPCERQWCS